MNPINNETYNVIDISHHNADKGPIDFVKIKNAYSAVYIKASEGTSYIDPTFNQYLQSLKSNNIPFGCYHWLSIASVQHAIDQADYFYNLIKDCGYACIPTLDIEERKADKNETIAEVKAFLGEFEKVSGIKAMIYASTSYINELLADTELSAYKLWVAHYGVSEPASNVVWGAWDMWQYGSDGNVDGITGDVDMDKATSSIFISNKPKSSPAPVQPAQVNDWNNDVYKTDDLPYQFNSRANTDFDIRDSSGNHIGSHEVSKGDEMCIIDVIYDKQLTEIYYPLSSGGYAHGYISNLQNLISDYYHYQWQNGSTPEPTYDVDGNRIGSIDPHEQATPLYRGSNGRLCLLYNTAIGMETKCGYVDYNGKFNRF